MATILLLEDSADIAQMLEILLRMQGHIGIPISTQKALLKEIPLRRPELIIIDVKLPDSDGREVCKALKLNPATKDISVILTSATPQKLEGYKNYFADAIIEKPFNIEMFLSTVESVLKKSAHKK